MLSVARNVARAGAARHAGFWRGAASAAAARARSAASPMTSSCGAGCRAPPLGRSTIPVRDPACDAPIRPRCAPFSSGGGNKTVVDVRRSSQKEIWGDYLSGKTSAADLFAEIDLNYSGTISVQEINYFLDSVDREGVGGRAFDTLQELGEDHELDAGEFGGWLAMATADRSGEEGKDSEEPPSDPPEAADAQPQPEKKKKLVDARHGFQKLVWEQYLSTGKHGDDLFLMIDLNKNRTISVEEIIYFLDSVERKGVRDVEFDRLVAMGNDHELNKEEFLEWLTNAAEIEEHGEARFGASGCTPGQW